MNAAKEKLICRLIDCRIQNLLNNGAIEEWVADALNFGWVGYDKHSDEEILQCAEDLELDNLPLLEDLKD